MNPWEKPGLTPEERVRLVAERIARGVYPNLIGHDAWNRFRDHAESIAKEAIEAAVQEEREACATIAETHPLAADTHTGTRQKWLRESIAEAIRGGEAAGSADEFPNCANCGVDKATLVGGELNDEAVCSTLCYDQLTELGCPHEHYNAYRHPVETEQLTARAEKAEEEVERLREAIATLERGLESEKRSGQLAHIEWTAARDGANRLRARAEKAEASLGKVASLLSANGCDCDCDHGWEDHEDGCERCLGCRIEMAAFTKETPDA